jgi:hypothetical protein
MLLLEAYYPRLCGNFGHRSQKMVLGPISLRSPRQGFSFCLYILYCGRQYTINFVENIIF